MGARRGPRSTWSGTSAARRRCSARWTCPAGGPAASAPGTTTASISRPAARRRTRSDPAGAAAELAGLVGRLVPVRRPPHRGPVPDRAQLRGADPAAGGAGRPGHAGGRSRARDQQPGRGRGARGGRRSRSPAAPAVVAGAARRRGTSRRSSSPASTSCAASSAGRPPTTDPMALADREEEVSDWLSAHGVERGMGHRAVARRGRRRRRAGASGWRGARGRLARARPGVGGQHPRRADQPGSASRSPPGASPSWSQR